MKGAGGRRRINSTKPYMFCEFKIIASRPSRWSGEIRLKKPTNHAIYTGILKMFFVVTLESKGAEGGASRFRH